VPEQQTASTEQADPFGGEPPTWRESVARRRRSSRARARRPVDRWTGAALALMGFVVHSWVVLLAGAATLALPGILIDHRARMRRRREAETLLPES
jgi:hypothetical protein